MKINLKSYHNLAEMIDITLREEIDETETAISNERLWAKVRDVSQASLHEENACDLEEWRSILQYAIDNGVIYCEKEIHCIWAELLLRNFMNELSGMVENSKCMGLDTDMEEELIDTLRDILEEM